MNSTGQKDLELRRGKAKKRDVLVFRYGRNIAKVYVFFQSESLTSEATHKLTFKSSSIMAHVNFFLDTNALIALGGLKGSNLHHFKDRIETLNSELATTHIQVDEIAKHIKFHEPVKKKHEKKVQSYQQKIDEALKTLKSKGINVRIEATKIPVAGIARAGYVKTASKEVGKLYNELRKEIDGCERARGKIKPLLNIACDATIAVSSLNHDFFVTSDKCLSESWLNVIGKYEILRQQFKIPKVIYTKRYPKEVAKQILENLESK